MKSLYKLTDKNKSTYFSLLIYDLMDKIDKRTEEWFDDVFFKKIVPEEIYTRNLLMDLDYIFSEGIWIIKLAEKEKLDIKDVKKSFGEKYKTYTKNGYRMLVHNEKYNSREHRIWTDSEIKENKERMSKIANEILDEILQEEKSKK